MCRWWLIALCFIPCTFNSEVPLIHSQPCVFREALLALFPSWCFGQSRVLQLCWSTIIHDLVRSTKYSHVQTLPPHCYMIRPSSRPTNIDSLTPPSSPAFPSPSLDIFRAHHYSRALMLALTTLTASVSSRSTIKPALELSRAKRAMQIHARHANTTRPCHGEVLLGLIGS